MSYPTYFPTIGNSLADELDDALSYATKKHGPFPTAHHGIAVIQEEFEELKEAVFRDQAAAQQKHEALQLAAMCIRFIKDLDL